tara:strand:+ start:2235 stop:3161 length:927 start_codon:yes stop_codon:yes gene_type:complete
MPILHSGLETDLRLAAIIEREIHALLTDQASMRTSGAINFMGDVAGMGSDTMRVRYAGLDGFDSFAATAAENTDVAETTLTDASADIAVVRAALRYDIGDLANLTGVPGADVDPFRLASSMVGSFEQYFNGLVASAITTVTANEGASGTNLSVDNWFSAMAALETASVPGPYWAMLFPQQLSDLKQSLRSEQNALQELGDVQAQMKIFGQGFAGNLLGVNVYVSSDVATANTGADSAGCMWGQGAFGYAIGTPRPLAGAGGEVRAAGTPVVVEFQRDASAALTEVVGHAYCGVSLIEDDRAVQLITDR